MIGLLADRSEMEAAAELFELFKTPWEPCVPSRHYAAVLSTRPDAVDVNTDLLLVYAASEHPIDRRHDVGTSPSEVGAGFSPPDVRVVGRGSAIQAEWGTDSFPLYGGVATFDGTAGDASLRVDGHPIEYRRQSGSQVVWRFGYDLLREVDHLLRHGQPPEHAQTPTLELHIALLRRRLLDEGYPLVEIPPRPDGYDFTCCLTHDVDFYGIRRHMFDMTLAGFVVRASIAPVADLVLRRRPMADSLKNWTTLLSLPMVMAGIARDFWLPFEAYARIEKGAPSTYFLIPFRDRPGVGPDGKVTGWRGVRYQASDIRADLVREAARGTELAVHGIDAWRDADAGRAERAEVAGVTGQRELGVRMHWLFFEDGSAQRLEEAGFHYDSTCGYNDAVGYWAGTPQVFKLPGTRALLELSLTLMDTALFYRDRMGLSFEEAMDACRRLIANGRRFGGALVVNWHERSLAAERLWGRCYEQLLKEAGAGGRTWFATAGDAVSWFRWRRSVQFASDASGALTITAPARPASLPAAQVAIYSPAREGARADHVRLEGGQPMTLQTTVQVTADR